MHKISWTPEAENSFLAIIDFWTSEKQANQYALKIITEVERIENIVLQHPHIGTQVEGTSVETRRIVVLTNYSITYRIHNNFIEILSFWDNRQDPKKQN